MNNNDPALTLASGAIEELIESRTKFWEAKGQKPEEARISAETDVKAAFKTSIERNYTS